MHQTQLRQAAAKQANAMHAPTGIAWDDKFTDVPDDGNCSMHAFWLGLRTLVQLVRWAATLHVKVAHRTGPHSRAVPGGGRPHG